MVGNVIKSINSMSMGPLPQFTYFEVSFFVRSNAMCNTMTANEVFHRSIDCNFGRSTACREGKSACKVSVHSNKNKMLPFPWWKQSNILNLPPGSWLILGNGILLRTQCCFLLLPWCTLLNTPLNFILKTKSLNLDGSQNNYPLSNF